MSIHGFIINSRFQSPFYVQRQVFRQHYERFSKIFRASKALRHFRNYFANPNHPEFWEPFLTFGIIGKFSEPFRDFGIFLHMAGHKKNLCCSSYSKVMFNTITSSISLVTSYELCLACQHLIQIGIITSCVIH